MPTFVSSSFHETTNQDRTLPPLSFWRKYRRVVCGCTTLIIASYFLLPAWMSTPHGSIVVHNSRVLVSVVERGSFIRDFVADGKVVAANSPTLYAPASGLMTIHVAPGDTVKQGALLASMESPELDARLAIERASLEAQALDLERARLETRRIEELAHQQYAKAELEFRSAHREYERSRKAYESGAYAEMQMARAGDTMELARFTLEQAKSNLMSQPEQVRFDIESRGALLRRQQLTVEDLERQAQALSLRSPVDGQIGQMFVPDRASISRDMPILSVIDLSRLMVEIQAPENFARDLMPGMTAELTGNGGTWLGRVETVSPEIVEGQVTARVAFAEPQPAGLRQSQRLSVRVLIESREDVLSVERGSFFDRGSGHVFRVDENETARRVPVKLGAASMSRVEILEGLSAGDRVVVSGAEAFGEAEQVILSH